jgi:ankyrin repeat protein
MTGELASNQLIDAITAGDYSLVARLLDAGPASGAAAYTEDGWSLLHLAPTREITELLLSHGAYIEAPNRHKVFGPGNRPLHAAVYMDRPKVVDALIEAGADVSSTDDSGWTPLHLAVSNGRLELARRLLEAGADVNARIANVAGQPWANCTPLELLHLWDRTGEGSEPLAEDVKADLWKLLRDHGATAPRHTEFRADDA